MNWTMKVVCVASGLLLLGGAGYLGYDQMDKVAKIDGRVTQVVDRVETLESMVTKNQKSTEVTSNVLDSRLAVIEGHFGRDGIITGLSAAVAEIPKAIEQNTKDMVAVERDRRIKAENDLLLKMVREIKANDAESDIGAMDDAAIAKQLNNGQVDIEPLIREAWSAMRTEQQSLTTAAIDNATVKAEAAQETANVANDSIAKAAEAIRALAEPTKPGRHSVSGRNKARALASVDKITPSKS
jgi:hypothetical protein